MRHFLLFRGDGHVFLLILDDERERWMRVESLHCRVDVQPIDYLDGWEWLYKAIVVGWDVVEVKARWRAERRWRPAMITCVGLSKRILGAPWWILTPAQLRRWADRNQLRRDDDGRLLGEAQ